MSILNKLNKNKKGKVDVTILLHIQRNDGIESMLTFGRRKINSDGDYFFAIKNPYGSNWYETADIPSENRPQYPIRTRKALILLPPRRV